MKKKAIIFIGAFLLYYSASSLLSQKIVLLVDEAYEGSLSEAGYAVLQMTLAEVYFNEMLLASGYMKPVPVVSTPYTVHCAGSPTGLSGVKLGEMSFQLVLSDETDPSAVCMMANRR